MRSDRKSINQLQNPRRRIGDCARQVKQWLVNKMSSEGNTEDVIIDFCNASQQEQGKKKRKSYSYGLQCVAMDCNKEQYSWKNGINQHIILQLPKR